MFTNITFLGSTHIFYMKCPINMSIPQQDTELIPSEMVLMSYEWSSQSLTTNSIFLKRFPRVRGTFYSDGIGS